MAKIVLSGIAATEKLLSGVNTITEAVAATLGPRGNNVAIKNPWGSPSVVHDGVTVAKAIDLVDPFEDIGAQLIKEAASKTNDVAGDGTTTATILTHALVTEGAKNLAAGSNAMMLRRGIDKAVPALVARLKDMAQPVVTDDEIVQVATISAQNEEIGRLIAGAIKKIGKDGVVTVEDRGGTDISVEYREGMEFDRGYLSPYFITNPETAESEVETPLILLTDKRLKDVQEMALFLDKIIKEANVKQFVIIAADISPEVLAFMLANHVKGVLRIVGIKAPGYGDKQVEQLKDIAALTGAEVISDQANVNLAEVTAEQLGSARRVVCSKDSTIIVDGKGAEEDIKSRVAFVRSSIEKATSEFETERLQERLAKLTSGIAIVNVGANSEAEAKELKERIIDAIAATKAALEEGIVPGGETALIRALPALDGIQGTDEELVGVRLVRDAIVRPFKRLMQNSGFEPGEMLAAIKGTKDNFGVDVIDGKVKDLVKAGVVDPVKVTRSALQNAASAAVMIMTTNVLIVDEPKSSTSDQPSD